MFVVLPGRMQSWRPLKPKGDHVEITAVEAASLELADLLCDQNNDEQVAYDAC